MTSPPSADHDVQLVTATGFPTAVVAVTTTWEEFSRSWRDMLDAVYAFLAGTGAAAGVRQTGHNVMLYRDDVPHVEVGVQVAGAFTPCDRVVPSTIPAGPAAMTVHRGRYEDLDIAHRAVRMWCAGNGVALAGPRWEIYGDWKEDPDELETEVYYLVAEPFRDAP